MIVGVLRCWEIPRWPLVYVGFFVLAVGPCGDFRVGRLSIWGFSCWPLGYVGICLLALVLCLDVVVGGSAILEFASWQCIQCWENVNLYL